VCVCVCVCMCVCVCAHAALRAASLGSICTARKVWNITLSKGRVARSFCSTNKSPHRYVLSAYVSAASHSAPL
jgi:hypothetical protein